MIIQPYHLYVERIEPEKNMARFYALAVQPTLFGEVALVRSWGRIGTHGQQKAHVFNEEKRAIALFLEILREKRNRGYKPKLPVEIEAFGILYRSASMTKPSHADRDSVFLNSAREFHDHQQ